MSAVLQIRNKFYKSEQRVMDLSGADWVQRWGPHPSN